jgi:hypothetical protein
VTDRLPTVDRHALLRVLLDYADESKNFNPLISTSELRKRLGVDDAQLNRLHAQLGHGYLHATQWKNNEWRYAINVSACLNLKGSLDQEELNARRHAQAMRVTFFCAILGAVLAAALTIWFLS